MKRFVIGCLALLTVAADAPPPPPADPLTVEVETADADRFAALWRRTAGKPDTAAIQREYLAPGSYGVRVFTPDRIVDAANLARAVAADPALYARAVDTCLPLVKETTPELRATYLALAGLFPGRPLPRLYLVVGADNSGGTAGPGAQVLGLEVICRLSATPEALRTTLRAFYAHETVHVLQGMEMPPGNLLLASVLVEGAADFIATLVTGRQIDPERAAWGMAREAELWRQFERDLVATKDADWGDLKRGTPAGDAFFRWIGNAGAAPAGWPGEAGYWIGQRIWQRWYARQPDKRAAVAAMLQITDPAGVLATAGPPAR